MNLLAIDTAASVLSAAVAAEDAIAYTETEAGTRHSELVMDCIDAVMRDAGLRPNDIDGILCMGGPGSFTGLRIGFSVGKGLALALNIPFAPVPTLDCMALGHSSFASQTQVMPVIAAIKNAFFFALYRNGERLGPDMDATTEQIAAVIDRNGKTGKTLLTGPGADRLYNALPQEVKPKAALAYENRGYAKDLIDIAKKYKIFDNDNSAHLFEGPEYIRKSDAELNLTGNAGN